MGPCADAIGKDVCYLEYLGSKSIIRKNVQGSAIVVLSQAIRDRWAGEVVPEEAPAYDPEANGVAERVVRSFQEQRRAVELALEAKVEELGGESNIQSWLAACAG
eukprot:9465843-Lingulodinium_polyedra.AAC.1